jgi:dihydrofolate reductase
MKKKTRQRRIIARLAISADGYIARPDGSVDFLNERPHPKHSYGMGEFYKSIDTILWGRKTIDTLLEFQKQGIKGARFVFSLEVVPVMIGEGIPLVAPRHRRVPLKLVSTRTFEDGVVHLEYAVVK